MDITRRKFIFAFLAGIAALATGSTPVFADHYSVRIPIIVGHYPENVMGLNRVYQF